MNVYDTVNKLAQEIRNSDEYINYKKIKEEVNADLELKKKIENFQKMRYEVQLESLRTGDQENPKIKEMQEEYMDLIKNEKAKQYFDMEIKFSILIGDVNKIIGETVKELL